MLPVFPYIYQAGGCLPITAPSYVKRQADEVLYAALKAGEFCYILNARQMGKSSLRVQMTERLRSDGIRSGVIDMTTIGSQQMTAEQWYASVLQSMVSSFRLQVNLRSWWRDRTHLSSVKRFDEFLETVLLTEIEQPIVVFVDEVDSVLGLNFPIDDFFALIRACYNRRVDNPIYQRLTFALLGVATPSDLIADKNRTPFNIGQAIDLKGFRLSEALPLLPGLQETVKQPEAMLRHILQWTDGQPFLTQKLCQLVCDAWQEGTIPIPMGQEVEWLDHLVRSRIINYWELQDEPEHLRTIAHRLLYDEQRAGRLLGLYQQILTAPQHTIAIDHSSEQIELLLSGLVVKDQGFLRVRNPIYAAVFNANWVEQQLNKLRPYAMNLREWLKSDRQDDSRLLQGQVLREAEIWSDGKRIDDQDYQFLAASHALEQRKQQQALEAARTREVEARLAQERKTSQLQRFLLGIVSLALVVTTGLALVAYTQYRLAKVSEIQALAGSSEALFASDRRFRALIEALRAKQQWRRLGTVDPSIGQQIETVLRQAMYGVVEANRLSGHQQFVFGVTFSPDGQRIATASGDGTIKLWHLDGALLQTLEVGSLVYDVKFSPDSQFLMAATGAGEVRRWNRDGQLVWTWKINPNSKAVVLLRTIAVSPDGERLAIASENNTVELLQSQDGRRIRSLKGHQNVVWGVAFSPDGQRIASASQDNTIKLWHLNGKFITTLTGHDDRVNAVTFSPDGQMIASVDAVGIMKLWDAQGRLLQTIKAHGGLSWDVMFSPDGQRLVSTSDDRTIKLWNREGGLLQTLHHGETIYKAAFSPDGQWLASAGGDRITKLWRFKNPVLTTLQGHQERIARIRFSPNGDRIASPSWDNTVKLWDRNGRLLNTFRSHTAPVNDVDFHPDGQRLVSNSSNGIIYLWQADGSVLNQFSMLKSDDPIESTQYIELSTLDFSPNGQLIAVGNLAYFELQLRRPDGSLVASLKGHQGGITQARFSPTGEQIVTASMDGTAKLWNREGHLQLTLIGHKGVVWGVAFSPDGRWIATAGEDSTVKLWRAADGQLVRTFAGHTSKVYSITFSPDGQMIASAGRDLTIKFWNLDGTLITSSPTPQGVISEVTFSPDGELLASGGWDDTVIIWKVREVAALTRIEQIGCDWVRDYLRSHPDPGLCNGINPADP